MNFSLVMNVPKDVRKMHNTVSFFLSFFLFLTILFLILHLLPKRCWYISAMVLGIGNHGGEWCIETFHLCGQLKI